MNLKQVLDQHQGVDFIKSFNDLIGDTIKEKFESILVECLVICHQMGGHNDCMLITNPKDDWIITFAEPPGYVGKTFKEEWVPDSLVEENIQAITDFGGLFYYSSEEVRKNQIAIAKAKKWELGKPTSFDVKVMEIKDSIW